MAGPNIGFATLSVIPSMKGAQAALTSGVSGPASAAGAAGARSFGSSFGSALKKGGLIAGGIAAAAGAGLLALGTSLDDAFDTIRIGTGATGEVLEGLKGTFEDVVSNVPASFGDAATAVADLNTRLGITGEPLEDMAARFLELSRITGTDVAGNIESLTRVFGDWGIATEDQAEALDAIFRASQATGAGIDQLGRQAVQFGAPLRQMGFGFDETLALLGKFEKEGVNTELVMGSLRIALGKFAREGESAPDAMRRLTAEIQAMEDPTQATARAMEVFGARAGADMAGAIREGRFNIDELFSAVADGEETILGVAAETSDWRQSLQILMNKVMIRLAPLATKVFDGITRGMEVVLPVVETIVADLGERLPKAFGAVSEAASDVTEFVRRNAGVFTVLAGAVGGAVAVLTAYKVAVNAVNAVTRIWTAVQAAFNVVMAANPVVLMALAIGALIGAVVAAYFHFEEFRNVVDTVFRSVRKIVGTVIGAVQKVIEKFVDVALDLWERFGGTITELFENAWQAVQEIVEGVIDVIQGIWDTFAGLFTGDWRRMWDGIVGILGGAWDAVVAYLRYIWDTILTLLGDALPAVAGLLADLGGAFLSWIVDVAKATPGKLAEWLAALGDWIVTEAIPAAAEKLGELGLAFVQWVADTVPDLLLKLGKWYLEIQKWIFTEGIPKLAGALVNMGVELWQWILNAIPTVLAKLGEMAWSMIGWVATEGVPAMIGIGTELATKIAEGIGNIAQWAFEKLGEVPGKLWEWLLNVAGELVSLGAAVANKIMEGIGDLAGRIVDELNILGKVEEKLGISVGGGPTGPDGQRLIGGYDTGGIVGGRRGAPQLALVHGGETVLPTHRMDPDEAFDRIVGRRSGAGVVIEEMTVVTNDPPKAWFDEGLWRVAG